MVGQLIGNERTHCKGTGDRRYWTWVSKQRRRIQVRTSWQN